MGASSVPAARQLPRSNRKRQETVPAAADLFA
jgi:hypothetical protein